VLGELVARAPRGSDEIFRHIDAWLRVAPFDQRPHEVMLEALLKCGRFATRPITWPPRFARSNTRGSTGRRCAKRGTPFEARRPSGAVDIGQRRARVSVTVAVDAPVEPRPRRRASIAIMPFVDHASSGQAERSRVADGLTEDIITRLAKLRVLFVIARGTVYALGERGIGPRKRGAF